MRRRARVVAEHRLAGGDFDSAHVIHPAHLFDVARMQVRRVAGRGDLGVVVEEHRDAPLCALEQRVDLAVDEADRIVRIANRKRCDHYRLGVELQRILEVLQRLGARMPGDADPGFDCHAGGVDAMAFVNHHARDLLAARIVELVPLAGGACGEDDVGAVAALHRPAHDCALLVLEHLARTVEDSDDRHRKPRGWARSDELPARPPAAPPVAVQQVSVVSYLSSCLVIEKNTSAKLPPGESVQARDHRIPRPSRVMNVWLPSRSALYLLSWASIRKR